ncbi:uncharacterized protein LOC106141946 isoform X2 [Amyelois transitella]|uniref:uncharacterized protein LOC106141946 isoform X2 n=1 Tax=Amyelois transitella TaxID=680683 RepID=UPI00299041D3|nr:uncharacterized protein LOC106141946 isoform X2 [Amyelois transitella]
MKYKFIWIIYCLNNIFQSCLSQYPPPTYRKSKSVLNPCENNMASLVEHFFSIIFSEFRNPQPVCVCVQMCPNQATYCYPNGCLRKTENNRKVAPSQQEEAHVLRVENKRPMFLVDNSGNQVAEVVDEVGATNAVTTTEPPFKKPMNKYPFDNYKTIYKYRKLPRVHMQYNLREQVKNSKSNTYSDVGGNRWPLNKIKQVTIPKTYETEPDVATKSPVHFISMPSIIPRYFKRDLRSHFKHASHENISYAEKIPAEPEKFSLEKLINDLIASSLENLDYSNNTDIGIEIISKVLDNDTNAMMYNNKKFISQKEVLDTSSSTMHETTAASLNETADNSNNKSFEYEDDTLQTPKEMFINIYNDDAIESLSKRIDKLNNTSYELINTTNEILITPGDFTVTQWATSSNKTEEINYEGNDRYKNFTLIS